MIDIILRGAVMGTILTTALLMQLQRHQSANAATALGVSALCYVFASAPEQLSPAVKPVLIAGATLAPVALTWFAVIQLTENRQHQVALVSLAVLTVISAMLGLAYPILHTLRGGLAVLLYFALVLLALLTDQDDLVAKRRRFRRGFLATMALMGLIISVIEAGGLDENIPAWLYPFQAGGILLLSLAYSGWALSHRDQNAPLPRPNAIVERPARTKQIEQAMKDGIWQREGLTIGDMAKTLGMPEHQLRATINGSMGYRNFSTFINSARIDAAKAMLRDPAREGTTILEIAHEVGFASLGPFNKAFRAQTGLSPREYRR